MAQFNVNCCRPDFLAIFPGVVIQRASKVCLTSGHLRAEPALRPHPTAMRKDTLASQRTSCHASPRTLTRIASPRYAIFSVDTHPRIFLPHSRGNARITSKRACISLTIIHVIFYDTSSLGIRYLPDMDHYPTFECACVSVDHKAHVLMCCSGTLCGETWTESKARTWTDTIGSDPLGWDPWPLAMIDSDCFIIEQNDTIADPGHPQMNVCCLTCSLECVRSS